MKVGPPIEPPLVAGDVHLWLLDLDSHHAGDDERLLDAYECARASRFVRAEHRRRYITHRAWLRRVLGLYVDLSPARLAFGEVANGKPVLSNATLEFNLSHAGPLALLAVGRDALGVDLELQRATTAPLEIAERHFAPTELAWIRADPREMPARFLVCWTRKEAFIKATGEGLARGLASFDVRPAEAGPVAVHEIHGDGAPWYVQCLRTRPDAFAALCSRLAAPRLCWPRPPAGRDAALRPASGE